MNKMFFTAFFLAVTSLSIAQQLTEAEYFIGTDPGEGNGTPITFSDGTGDFTLEELEASIPSGSFSEGPQVLSIRFKNQDDTWTAPFKTVVVLNNPSETPSISFIEEAEYFTGSDPGTGNGTALALSDGTGDFPLEQVESSFLAESLTEGAQTLSIRFKDGKGNWSPLVNSILIRNNPEPTTPIPVLNTAEFFVGPDPGEGSGTAFTLKDGTANHPAEPMEASLTTESLEPGNTLIGVRFQNVDNEWSSPILVPLSVTMASQIPAQNKPSALSGAEVFAGDDPGEGNGKQLTEITTLPSSMMGTWSETFQIPASSDAALPFMIRFKKDESSWSQPVQIGLAMVNTTHDILLSWEHPDAADSLRHFLTANGYLFDEWDRVDGSSPTLRGWKTVLWDEKDFLSKAQRDSITAYLNLAEDQSFLIAGKDIAEKHDLGKVEADSTFLRQILHAKFIRDDAGTGPFALLGTGIHESGADTANLADSDVFRPLYGAATQIIWQSTDKPDSALAIAFDGLSNLYYTSIPWQNLTTGLNAYITRIFQWVESSGGSLPVELISFTGSWSGRSIQLKWSTASELNNAGFSIWRKKQDLTWEQRGFLAGAGTTNLPKAYEFSDSDVLQPTLTYQLRQSDTDGTDRVVGEIEIFRPVTKDFILHPNYPNPFNPATTIPFEVPATGLATLTIFNILGQEVFLSARQIDQPGLVNFVWNGKDRNGSPAATGRYWFQIDLKTEAGGDQSRRGSMILLK